MEITALTALELGKRIKAGEVTVEEAVKAQRDSDGRRSLKACGRSTETDRCR